MSQNGVRIHSSAFVEDGAIVGDGTAVWHGCHIRSGASIGDGCVLGKNVFVDAGVSVGNRVKVQNNVSVYAGVTIEDDVFVGPSAVFTNDRTPRAFSQSWKITPTLIMKGASIGANATIVCGNNVGSYAMVAAGATVTRTVREHELVGGLPARTLGWVCKCGVVISRDDESPAEVDLVCSSCKEKVS
jgi:UDP-2-acetamido-3-amino-2,3-dideoxy-glucuronate N-acetyltransferase